MDSWTAGLRGAADAAYFGADRGVREYMEVVAGTLGKLLPGDLIAWNGIDLRTGEVVAGGPDRGYPAASRRFTSSVSSLPRKYAIFPPVTLKW